MKLSLDQIVDAVRRLPKKDRQYVISHVLSDAGEIPQGQKALAAFERRRGEFRLDPKREERLSDLLAKANETTLSVKEQAELNALLDESHQKTMELALAVISEAASSKSNGAKSLK